MDVKKLTKKVEEVSQKYTNKFKINRDKDWFILKLQEELGELTQAYLMMSNRGRTRDKTEEELRADFAKEVADVFCQILLLANAHNIDLNKEVEDKWLVWNK
jgi:NTP pyrophosphatase (non-canonical NTP hydrolase)